MGWSGPLTHRQYLAWQAWFDAEWDRPNRTDNYLMSIACEVRRSQSKRPARHKLEHMRLKFRRKHEQTGPPSQAQIDAAKAVWMARVGRVGPRPGQS